MTPMKGKLTWLRVLPILVFLLIVVLAMTALNQKERDFLPSVLIGKSAPPINLAKLGLLPLLTDENLNTPDPKKIILVNFWASWCPPCRVEHPQLERISKMENVEIFGINFKDKEFAAKEFLYEYGNPYSRVGRDPAGRNAIEWGVYGVPETFILDQTRKIIYRHPGPITFDIYNKKIKPFLN